MRFSPYLYAQFLSPKICRFLPEKALQAFTITAKNILKRS